MRLITDEQHAQIVEALIYRSDCDAKEAVATLQALPEGVLYEWKYEDIYGNEIGPPTLFYATKEPS